MTKPERIVQNENIAVFAALLFDNVEARDAEVHASLPHTDHDVTGPIKDDPQIRQGRKFCLVLPRVGLEHCQPRGGEKAERLVLKAAFGWERESNA